jgi:hypothetical protein
MEKVLEISEKEKVSEKEKRIYEFNLRDDIEKCEYNVFTHTCSICLRGIRTEWNFCVNCGTSVNQSINNI